MIWLTASCIKHVFIFVFLMLWHLSMLTGGTASPRANYKRCWNNSSLSTAFIWKPIQSPPFQVLPTLCATVSLPCTLQGQVLGNWAPALMPPVKLFKLGKPKSFSSFNCTFTQKQSQASCPHPRLLHPAWSWCFPWGNSMGCPLLSGLVSITNLLLIGNCLLIHWPSYLYITTYI